LSVLPYDVVADDGEDIRVAVIERDGCRSLIDVISSTLSLSSNSNVFQPVQVVAKMEGIDIEDGFGVRTVHPAVRIKASKAIIE
jgi:hypothetical protein